MIDDSIPFNPLDRRNLQASVAEALLSRSVYPLGELPVFQGAGIYVIYYSGGFSAYAELANRNLNNQFTAPIYIGKAVHAGARRGGGMEEGDTTRKPLFSRLSEHAESIRSVENLDLREFHCRFLVVDDIWIPLGESLLIGRFSPVWNAIIDGFGNHDPGSGRYGGMRPRWDVLHPGRTWAARCRERPESPDDIARDVATYLRNAHYPVSTRFIGIDQS